MRNLAGILPANALMGPGAGVFAMRTAPSSLFLEVIFMRMCAIVGLFALTALVGCGNKNSSVSNGACSASGLAGTWQGNVEGTPDTLNLNGNCSGTSTACQANFTYQAGTQSYGSLPGVTLNVSTSNGALGCPNQGTNNCSYSLSGNSLTLYCGDSTASYSK